MTLENLVRIHQLNKEPSDKYEFDCFLVVMKNETLQCTKDNMKRMNSY